MEGSACLRTKVDKNGLSKNKTKHKELYEDGNCGSKIWKWKTSGGPLEASEEYLWKFTCSN